MSSKQILIPGSLLGGPNLPISQTFEVEYQRVQASRNAVVNSDSMRQLKKTKSHRKHGRFRGEVVPRNRCFFS
ncbi:hypothetical protein M7I_2811 [Glarea lozoyensis 74030]|uniref:Uncharacterized protein n=1 Tax=Glarea lozoyensis (strain ATCC 74030 / MF5533) TaxID=1104152 RepID=H0EJT1_GLAL7|nr:hypothetical protein M7I_2811 [Glarea lozoyensis 74030]